MIASVWMKRIIASGYLWCCFVLPLHAQQASDFSLPAPKLERGQKRRLWATWYKLYEAKENAKGIPLKDTHNHAISVRISAKEWCLGAMSGAISIKGNDGVRRTYDYIDSRGVEQVDCHKYVRNGKAWVSAIGRSRFEVSTFPYGDGFGHHKLVPYRTIAVAKQTFPIGTVLYVPAARGSKIKLPNGRMAVHDGYFYVGDRGGGAVKKNHVDVFSGPISTNPFPGFIKHSPKGTFDAFVIHDKQIYTKLVALIHDAS